MNKLKISGLLILCCFIFLNCPAMANDAREVETIYRRFSTQLMPLLYETVEETIQIESREDAGDLKAIARAAYGLWVNKILNSPLIFQFPSAMLVASKISPWWFNHALKSQDISDDDFGVDRADVHKVIEIMLDIWGLAAAQNSSLIQVRDEFNLFFNCSQQDCEQWAENLWQQSGMTQQAAVAAFIECVKRQEAMPGLLLRHLCDLIFNKPVFSTTFSYLI